MGERGVSKQCKKLETENRVRGVFRKKTFSFAEVSFFFFFPHQQSPSENHTRFVVHKSLMLTTSCRRTSGFSEWRALEGLVRALRGAACDTTAAASLSGRSIKWK